MGFEKVFQMFPDISIIKGESWERTARQMHHRGSQEEMRPGSGASWCCEVGTLVGSLVGSLVGLLPWATLNSQLLCWFLLSLESTVCNLGGREGIINKEREKVEIWPKPALEQQFPRPPHCVMKWECELQKEEMAFSYCLGGESEEECVKWNQLVASSCLLEQALISMWIVDLNKSLFFGSSKFVYFLTNAPVMKYPMVTRTSVSQRTRPLRAVRHEALPVHAWGVHALADRHRLWCVLLLIQSSLKRWYLDFTPAAG